MKLELGQLGSGGVVYDIKPYDLPPNVFNKTLNVEFDGFSVKPMIEEVGLLTPLPETFEPIALHQGYVFGNLAVWVAGTADRLFILFKDAWFDITPEGLRSVGHWNIFSYNGYVICHSEENPPYYVDIHDWLTSAKEVPNWPANVRCRHLGGFSGFLVGLGLSSSDGFFDRQLVFWSDLAEAGSLPSNFNFSDPASRAGFVTLEGEEEFITGLPLGNSYIIYRSKSIYSMRFIGGVSVFAFERRDKNTRLLNRDSVCEIDGMHFFIGKDSFYFYDGIQKVPVGKGQVSDTLFKTWDEDTVRVYPDPDNLKLWIYYSIGSEVFGMCFRYKQSFFFPRSFDSILAIGSGQIFDPDEIDLWTDWSMSWLELDKTWELVYENEDLNRLVYATATGFVTVPKTGLFKEAFLERTCLAFLDTDQANTITLNRTVRKVIREVWPEMDLGKVVIQMGYAETALENPTYAVGKVFDASLSLKQDWIYSTKYPAFRISNLINGSTVDFSLTGFGIEVEFGGRY